jgi:hypothetical protein
MLSSKVVTPVKTGVQSFSNYPKTLDSGFRRNNEISQFFAFCETIKPERTKYYGKDCLCLRPVIATQAVPGIPGTATFSLSTGCQ